jgi:hypothetical protein
MVPSDRQECLSSRVRPATYTLQRVTNGKGFPTMPTRPRPTFARRPLALRARAALPALLVAATALLASARPAVAAEPRLSAEPRTFDTRHYRIRTDLDADFARDLAGRMDAMYDEYARRLSAFKPPDDVPRLEVHLFRTQADYLKFTGERLQNTGGVYIPRRNLLAAFLDGQGRDGLRRTLQHEAFHQFAYNVISPNLPVWLNEGMAQLFEEAIWDGTSFWLGNVPPRRVRQLRSDLGKRRLLDFDKVLAMTQEQWAANLGADGELGATQYNQCWAMVHFLTFAPDERDQPLHRRRLIQLLRLMHEGKDADAAFAAAFSPNVRGFQDRFTEYAAGLQPTATATLIERQGVLGDLLAELNKRGMRFATVAQFRRAAMAGGYRMHYAKGELTWESEKDLKVYFADMKGRPLGPDDLFFEARAGAPLPDIVCRSMPEFQLRTRFHRAAGGPLEHEILVETPAVTTGLAAAGGAAAGAVGRASGAPAVGRTDLGRAE